MPRISKVGLGHATPDYATRELWWANEAAVDYSGQPIVAEMLGDCGQTYTLSGASVNGAISYTKDVIHDGTNTSSLAVSKNITIAVTNSFVERDIRYESTNRYTLGLNLQSDSYSSERCIYQQISSAGGTAIAVAGHYPNSEIKNFLAFGGSSAIVAGYKRGTNFRKGLVYGSSGTGVNANYAEMVLTDIFAFNNVTDYLANSTKINCASEDATGTPGLTGYTGAETVNFATGDIRIKSTSPLAAAGIGAFIEESAGASLIFDIDVRQSILGSVIKDVDLRNAIFTYATSDIDVRNKVFSSVSSSLDIRSAILGSAFVDIDLRTKIFNAAWSDIDIRNEILGAAGYVVADLDARNSINSAVMADADVRNKILQAVESSVDVRNKVLNAIASDIDIRTSIYQSIASDIDLRNQVFGVSYTDLDIRNSVDGVRSSDSVVENFTLTRQANEFSLTLSQPENFILINQPEKFTL